MLKLFDEDHAHELIQICALIYKYCDPKWQPNLHKLYEWRILDKIFPKKR